jgi:hypothetical protein
MLLPRSSKEASMGTTSRTRLSLILTSALAVVFLVATPLIASDPPDEDGQWSAVYAWPCVGIHTHLLPNGKVLSWADDDNPNYPRDGTRLGGSSKVYVIDVPNGGAPGTVLEDDNSNTNLFCAGHVFLPDGTLLALGGHIDDRYGDTDANLFRTTESGYTWSEGDEMAEGRWYPTALTLANGEVLVVSGFGYEGTSSDIPEVWQTNKGGGWRELTGAQLRLDKYPPLHNAPDGRAYVSGPGATTYYFTTEGTGSFVKGPRRVGGSRNQGSAVAYAPGKILAIGGGNPPASSAEVVDLNVEKPKWKAVGSMHYARRNMNATILPDGTVLATGGCSMAGNQLRGAVYAADLWDPATEQWTKLASASIPRLYHSSAILLPDGRVLTAGGGRPAASDGDTDHKDAEIFSPPYLFRGARPTVTSAPSEISFGQTFHVSTPDSSKIAKVSFVRLSSATHGLNMNQLIQFPSFVKAGGGIDVTAPSSPNTMPPGHYLLFLLNDDGVPSIGRIVRID